MADLEINLVFQGPGWSGGRERRERKMDWSRKKENPGQCQRSGSAYICVLTFYTSFNGHNKRPAYRWIKMTLWFLLCSTTGHQKKAWKRENRKRTEREGSWRWSRWKQCVLANREIQDERGRGKRTESKWREKGSRLMGKYRMKGEEVRGLRVREGKRVAGLWEIQDKVEKTVR